MCCHVIHARTREQWDVELTPLTPALYYANSSWEWFSSCHSLSESCQSLSESCLSLCESFLGKYRRSWSSIELFVLLSWYIAIVHSLPWGNPHGLQSYQFWSLLLSFMPWDNFPIPCRISWLPKVWSQLDLARCPTTTSIRARKFAVKLRSAQVRNYLEWYVSTYP